METPFIQSENVYRANSTSTLIILISKHIRSSNLIIHSHLYSLILWNSIQKQHHRGISLNSPHRSEFIKWLTFVLSCGEMCMSGQNTCVRHFKWYANSLVKAAVCEWRDAHINVFLRRQQNATNATCQQIFRTESSLCVPFKVIHIICTNTSQKAMCFVVSK